MDPCSFLWNISPPAYQERLTWTNLWVSITIDYLEVIRHGSQSLTHHIWSQWGWTGRGGDSSRSGLCQICPDIIQPFPDAPCMEYLPAFIINSWPMYIVKFFSPMEQKAYGMSMGVLQRYLGPNESTCFLKFLFVIKWIDGPHSNWGHQPL